MVPPVLSNQNQQMDEAVINGANLFFAPQFHIDPNSGNKSQNQWLLGLVNSAPYVCMRCIKPSDTPADIPCSCVAPSLVAGSPNPSTDGWVVGAPSSSALSSHSLLASGKVSPIHGLISLLLALSLG